MHRWTSSTVVKLGVPHQPELAFGAIGEDGVRIVNDVIVGLEQLSDDDIATVECRERAHLSRRVEHYRRTHPRIPLTGRTVVIVDDGIATGATARAACRVARAQGASRVVVAAPVADREAFNAVRGDADDVICLDTPLWFLAIGQAYRHFAQVTDDDVTDLLDRAAAGASEPQRVAVSDPSLRDEEVRVPAAGVELTGHLAVPQASIGTVVFAHSSGSSRHSPRNRYLATAFHQTGLGTLQLDLLTPTEEIHRTHVLDIDLMSSRLIDATRWFTQQQQASGLPIGYFAAGAGTAAALRAATDPRVDIAAIVSRDGRPDLASTDLVTVRTPTLLIVTGHDPLPLSHNQRAQATMSCEVTVTLVPDAQYRFSGAATLDRVAVLACNWFVDHLLPEAADIRAGSTTTHQTGR